MLCSGLGYMVGVWDNTSSMYRYSSHYVKLTLVLTYYFTIKSGDKIDLNYL